MLSINTNLSSLIAQNSLKNSTDILNQSVERMTTGYKINHAKDNAANYSISTNMTTKIGAYQVAEDNAAMGLDMVTTAGENLSQMQSHAERLRALSIQARNSTYGTQSLNAIQDEANAITKEIERLYNTAKYNGVSLLNRTEYDIPDNMPKAKVEYGGFIVNPKTYEDAVVNAMASVTTFTDGASGEFKITSAEDLATLATFVNGGANTENATFVLANDIDLKEWCDTNGNWVPIGKYSTGFEFKGTFDGNGHTISNLRINNASASNQGLFGYASHSLIKNVNLKNVDIYGINYLGGVIGKSQETSCDNCIVSGKIKGTSGHIGGIVGYAYGRYISNCYSLAEVSAGYTSVGGIAGCSSGQSIRDSFAKGNINGSHEVGGLVGVYASGNSITNCYATGNVAGNTNIGGLVGSFLSSSYIINSCSTSNVNGKNFVGGLIGAVQRTAGAINIQNSTSFGEVSAESDYGSFIGGIRVTSDGATFATINITDCSSLAQNFASIGGAYHTDGTLINYDMTSWLAGITDAKLKGVETILQVGINGTSNATLSFDSNFSYNLFVVQSGIQTNEALNVIDNFVNLLSEKQTELGAVQNRLESVLEEISTQYENLVSSRSTLRDADMAKESSTYIQQQILQQASATLMATANQSPAIALQLI